MYPAATAPSQSLALHSSQCTPQACQLRCQLSAACVVVLPLAAGNGLLVSDGETWKRQRRLANPAFRRTAVERYAEEMTAAAQQLVGVTWGPAGMPGGTHVGGSADVAASTPVSTATGPPQARASSRPLIRDVYEDFNALTLRVTMAALFGVDSGSSAAGGGGGGSGVEVDAGAIVACVQRAFAYFAQRGAGPGMLIPEWLPTSDNIEMGRAVAQLDGIVYAIIAARRAELAASGRSDDDGGGGGAGRRDLLQALLESVDEEGRGGCGMLMVAEGGEGSVGHMHFGGVGGGLGVVDADICATAGGGASSSPLLAGRQSALLGAYTAIVCALLLCRDERPVAAR